MLCILQAAMRTFHESAEPSIRPDAYGRIPSHFYDSPVDEPSAKQLPLVQENVQLSRGYGVQGRESSVGLMSQHVKQERLSSPAKDDYNQPNEDVLRVGRKRKVSLCSEV